MWEMAGAASLVLLEGKKEQLNDFNESHSNISIRECTKGPGGRELQGDRWEVTSAGFNGQDLSMYFGESFCQFVTRGFHLSLRVRCILTPKGKGHQ